jgi:NAD(P)H-flavin reductase
MIQVGAPSVAPTVVNPMLTHPVTIRRVIWENDDTFTLTLDLDDALPEYRFLPGQFNMLYVYGMGEVAISISSDPSRKGTLDHTIHRVGSVTTALAHKKRGDVIGLRGPFGSTWPVDAARGKDVCIATGGIGLAPLRPVIYSILRERDQFGRVIVMYGGRSALDLLYRVELEKWENDHQVEALVTVDRGDTSWKGHIGVVTTLFSHIKLDTRNTVAFVCGPEVMMKYTVDELENRGLSQDQVYLSMERNMKCAVGFCGHCQMGPTFICKEGPVYPLPKIRHLLDRKEL